MLLVVIRLFYLIAWTFLLPVLYLLGSTVIKKWQHGLKMKLGQIPKEVYSFRKPLWFHAVSVGEFNALYPLLKMFLGTQMILSVSTQTAYELAHKKFQEEITNNLIKVFYMPWDHPLIIETTVQKIKPLAILLMESEIWPGLIIAAKKNKAKVIILNAKISDKSYSIYFLLGFIFEAIFKCLDLVLAQSPGDSRKYLNLKVPSQKLFMMGNIKFSALPNISYERRDRLKEVLGFAVNDLILVCGSTHEEEEAVLIAIFQELKERFKNLKLILAPRHPARFSVVTDLINSAAKLSPVKLSELKKHLQNKFSTKTQNFDEIIKASENAQSRRIIDNNEVLLADTIGDLFDIYTIANFAFVGGTLNPKIGGHNVLEPAVCNIPVLSGPYYTKNTDMYNALEEADGLLVCESKEDIRINIQSLIENEEKRILIGANAKNFTEKNRMILYETTKKLKAFLFGQQ